MSLDAPSLRAMRDRDLPLMLLSALSTINALCVAVTCRLLRGLFLSFLTPELAVGSWFYLYIYIYMPNPLFQTLSTTPVSGDIF
jgi:hypothetical protein